MRKFLKKVFHCLGNLRAWLANEEPKPVSQSEQTKAAEVIQIINAHDAIYSRCLTQSGRIAELEHGIRKFVTQVGDDWCWLDIQELANLLPEKPVVDQRLPPTEVFLPNCAKFERCLRSGEPYISNEQKECERLRQVISELKSVIVVAYANKNLNDEMLSIEAFLASVDEKPKP